MEHNPAWQVFGILFTLVSGIAFYRVFLRNPNRMKCPKCARPLVRHKVEPIEPLSPYRYNFINKTVITQFTGGWVFECEACNKIWDKRGNQMSREFLQKKEPSLSPARPGKPGSIGNPSTSTDT